MIILVKLFIPGKSPHKSIVESLQKAIAESLMEAKSDVFGENNYCQINIITEPLFLMKDGVAIENKDNLIQIKKNGTNLFRNTNETFLRESEKFEKDLLKKIGINIGNNLKILY